MKLTLLSISFQNRILLDYKSALTKHTCKGDTFDFPWAGVFSLGTLVHDKCILEENDPA